MEEFKLLTQGAESRLYTGRYLGQPTVLKERFEKKYRHPDLDSRLTKERIRAESRAINKAKVAGVATPTVYLVDLHRGSIFMEFIENSETLKSFIDRRSQSQETSKESPEWLEGLAKEIARNLVKLHSNNIVHGDLTTSNFLIRRPVSQKVTSDELPDKGNWLVLIDFGLARCEASNEDKAVDLYVLERSLLSSHSQHEQLFPAILSNYVNNVQDKKQRSEIVSKYEEVRARGRKRLMIG